MPNTTYTLINSGGSTAPGYGIFDGSGKLLAKANYNNRSTITFTTPANSSYIVYSVRISSTHEAHRYDKEYFAINGFVDATVKMVKPVNHTLTAEWTPLNHNIYFVNNYDDKHF